MLKAKYRKRWALWYMYERELSVIFLTSVALFFVLAIISYNPCDSSWFYYTSHRTSIKNICGPLGAYVAAFFFYFFGGASVIAACIVGWLAYCKALHRTLEQEWDRMLGWLLLMLTGATMSSLYSLDILNAPYPGGCVGNGLVHLLYRYFDTIGATLCSATLFFIALLLIGRLTLIHMVAACVSWISYRMRMQKANRGRSFVRQYMTQCFTRAADTISLVYTNVWARFFVSVPYVADVDYQESGHDQHLWDELRGRQYSRDVASRIDQQAIIIQECKDSPVVGGQEVSPDVPAPYQLPGDHFFVQSTTTSDAVTTHELEVRARILQEKLECFSVTGRVIAIKQGPVVTLFEYKPDVDAKISKIVALEDDLALALQALSIRIIAPIPGRAVVGFEVANRQRAMVLLGDSMRSSAYRTTQAHLPLILGKNTSGIDTVVDLATMPHLLVAGGTGSGKSVALHTMLISLLCKKTPDELRLILIDPKRLEFAAYADNPHLVFPVVTQPKEAAPILQWVVHQMEERYAAMAAVGARTLVDYNKKVSQDMVKPYLVIIIDELADLMITVGRDIETLIARIAQMARAAGIHMIVATQRPSVDVVTGLIKVNFPSRISFRVTSKIDSRTILDCGGAESLLGKGDMLFLDPTDVHLKRIHGAYVSDKEIASVLEYIRSQRGANYLDIREHLPLAQSMQEPEDILHKEVLVFMGEVDELSISMLQRRFRIGYNRAARIVENLEKQGLILPSEGGKTRKIVRSH